jgi:hypothetical protein
VDARKGDRRRGQCAPGAKVQSCLVLCGNPRRPPDTIKMRARLEVWSEMLRDDRSMRSSCGVDGTHMRDCNLFDFVILAIFLPATCRVQHNLHIQEPPYGLTGSNLAQNAEKIWMEMGFTSQCESVRVSGHRVSTSPPQPRSAGAQEHVRDSAQQTQESSLPHRQRLVFLS